MMMPNFVNAERVMAFGTHLRCDILLIKCDSVF